MERENYIQEDTQAITDLMRVWGQEVRSSYKDGTLSEKDIALRAQLIAEETIELFAAMGFTLKTETPGELGERQAYSLERHPDAVEGELADPQETLDALGDIVYVVKGAAPALGMDIDKAVLYAIHPSNMSKLDADGKVIKREDGKIMKSDQYFPPTERLKEVLEDGFPA